MALGLNGFHLTLAISWRRGRIRLEVESASVDDAEEGFTLVQSVSTEHGTVGQAS